MITHLNLIRLGDWVLVKFSPGDRQAKEALLALVWALLVLVEPIQGGYRDF